MGKEDDTLDKPCPICGERKLVWEGILHWSGGSKPPRNLARKEVTFSRRADLEREYLYHCENCCSEYYQDWERIRGRSPSIHLYEEGGVLHEYNDAFHIWEPRFAPKRFRGRVRLWYRRLVRRVRCRLARLG
jgi:hypothetical protein